MSAKPNRTHHYATPDMAEIVGHQDIVFLVLDALRYDVAEAEMKGRRLPNFAKLFPDGWERRHSPGSFTFPAHQAFFAGFLPTPSDPEVSAERMFAADFSGSETSGGRTYCFDTPDVVSGLAAIGYQTTCIGGVGFFNRRTALSCVLPDLFDESHWSEQMGVTGRDSTALQFALAAEKLADLRNDQKTFLFINISAIHQPNWFYKAAESGESTLGSGSDDLTTHAAALRRVDAELSVLVGAIRARPNGALLIVCSDHGTLYGEDGFEGHRVGHEAVFTVPYAHRVIEGSSISAGL